MDDANAVSRAEGIAELADQGAHQRRRQPPGALHQIGERFARRPFQREVVLAVRLSIIVCPHDPGVLHPRPVSRLAQKARNRVGVAVQA